MVRHLPLLIALLLPASTLRASQHVIPDSSPLGDSPALTAWLDSFFAERMRSLQIPGAAVVVVGDGRVLGSRGYGFASLEERRPVDPERTVFRTASVSKVFTATAVMQLAEQGRLDLHADVNRYLRRFRVEDAFGKPVTLANLLTHTAGFDERFIGMAARTPGASLPLGAYLARRMPPRVLPPGDVIAYSNHGLALAGLVVEEVSGVPFARYMDQNIIKPLGMRQSSFDLPPSLQSALATGYEYRDGAFRPVPLDDLRQLAPASSLVGTPSDIGRFMLAQLRLGRGDGGCILQQATARELQRPHFTQHPRLPGFAYGFYEHEENGQRALAHGGSWRGFASLLVLLPGHGAGWFVVSNRQQPRLGWELTRALMERFSPAPPPTLPAHATAGLLPLPGQFAGSYRSTRHARRTVEKVSILLEEFRVAAEEDGSLTVYSPGGFEPPTRWTRVDRLLYQRQDGRGYIAFREGAGGRITHLFLQAFGAPAALERLAWYETARFQLGLASYIFFFFLSACVGWPTSRFVDTLRRRAGQAPGLGRGARLLAGLTGGLGVTFFVAVELGFQNLRWLRLEHGMPRWLAALFVIPFLLIPMTLGVVALCAWAWRQRQGSWRQRVHYTLVTLAALLFMPFLLYWNLLGLHY